MSTFRTLDDLNIRSARQRMLDKFFDVMADKALGYTSKSAVTGMTGTNDPSLAEPVFAFAAVVAELSAFGKVAPRTVQTTPHIRVPTPLSDPAASWVGEGHPVPVARATWSQVTTGVSSLATIFVVSEDLLRMGDPRTRALITRQASRQLARALDTTFLGSAVATSTSPAGLLSAAPQLGGGSPANVGRDLSELFAYVTDGRASAPVLFMSPRVALYLATLDESLFRDVGINGGTIAGIPVITSAAAGSLITLLDADQLATFDGGVEVQPSHVASVEMLDNPTNDAATATATSVVSLFQTNSAAVKLVQLCDWRLLADDAVAFIELSEIGTSPS
jgi:HK97 family phage major capsid protein